MAITRVKKEEVLKELIEKMKKAKTMVFAQYGGIEVKNITGLRKSLREKNIDYKVAKKTLIKRASEEIGVKELPDDVLTGQVAIAFGYDDEISSAKAVYEFSKEYENLKIVGGISGGIVLNSARMIELAKIPSKETLLAQFAGMLRSPLNGFAGILNSPLSSFARAMKAYGEKNTQ